MTINEPERLRIDPSVIGVTWGVVDANDKSFGGGVEYVRADIHVKEVARLREFVRRAPCTCPPFAVETNSVCSRCLTLETNHD